MSDTGWHPGSSKRVLPSPHQDYLHISLVDKNNLYGLFHSDATENPQKASKSQVRHSSQWKIENIVNKLSEAGVQPRDEGQMLPNLRDNTARTRALMSVQSNVVKEYAKLKTTLQTWFAEDAEEISRWKQDSRSLARIDAKLVRESGGLVMQSFWRRELGWKESKSTKQLSDSKKVEYFFEAPIQTPNTKHKLGKKKFIWDFEVGKWVRAPNCPIAKAKKRSDRMAILDVEVQKIREIRDIALQKYGLGCVVKLNSDGSIDLTSGKAKDEADGRSEQIEKERPPPALVRPTIAIQPVTTETNTKRRIPSEGEEDGTPRRRVPAKRPRTIRALKQHK